MARWVDATPAGSFPSSRERRRQLMAKACTATPGRAASAASAPWQNAPMPVGSPRSGVASRATRRRGGGAPGGVGASLRS
ncbi:MAG TPA: hypothetical protein VGG09_04780 [Acidimicrobiales bacterium]